MSLFDTRTNTGSTTFTNAYSTVELLASADVQRASGFIRTTGWRYFEMKIEDQGGDNSRLFVGVGTPNFAGGFGPDFLVGGANAQADARTGVFAPPFPYLATALAKSLTACTGDVFMFAIDMTGGGRDHLGVQRVLTTSDGAGNILLPYFAEVGKNGVWPDVGKTGWSWPAHGVSMQMVPWAVRDSISDGTAKVTLRGELASFSYPLPAGMTPYGDGPEGGVQPIDDFALTWDPAAKAKVNLSGGNLIASNAATGEFPTTGYVMSVNLRGLTGKRYFEVEGGIPLPDYEAGFCDASVITNTAFDSPVSALLWWQGTSVSRRGVSANASMTCRSGPFVAAELPGLGVVVDFDNKLTWRVQPAATNPTTWNGEGVLPAASNGLPYPYSWGALSSVGGASLSITASTSQFRFAMKIRMDNPASTAVINGGQAPFTYYPLLPGVKSLNGGRFVTAGQGDSWDVVNNVAASISYGASGLSVYPFYKGVIQCAQLKNAGKKYFELHSEVDGFANGVYVGMRLDTATTMTNANVAPLLDRALVVRVSASGGRRFRYGVNVGTWSATSSLWSSGTGLISPWLGVAVDFDAGNMWVGAWNYAAKTMNWGAGCDPATGLNPHLTFTASTTLRICGISVNVLDNAQTGGAFYRTTLVQDDLNVIGKPAGFTTWGGTVPTSVTVTPSPSPSASLAGGLRNIWPTGVMT